MISFFYNIFFLFIVLLSTPYFVHSTICQNDSDFQQSPEVYLNNSEIPGVVQEVPYNIVYPANCNSACVNPLPQHQFYIAPTFYYNDRIRKAKNDSPSKQHGWIYGVRIGYDRIKRCRLYWGFEALYATGIPRGHKDDIKNKSRFIDQNVELRLGYTFQRKSGWLPTFIPYIGYGYLRESNKFKRPTPVIYKLRMSFDYIALGFLSQVYPSPAWVLGVNFKARILLNNKARISEDPYGDDAKLHFEDKVQYRVELPITYRITPYCDKFAIAFVPYYEYRHYGYQADFPYDFLDTKQNFYGCDLRLMYLF